MKVIETKDQILHKLNKLVEAYETMATRREAVTEAQKELNEWITITDTRRRDLETAVTALADFEHSKKKAST